jgi:heme/copper-type cytochrome/quinol oxidase subunit 2
MKKKNLISYLVVLVLFITLVATIFLTNEGNDFKDVSITGAATLLERDDVFVINTHTPYIGEIEGTDLIAENWQDIYSYQDELPSNKSTPILVYCRSGTMSSNVAKQLYELGYSQIYNLEGGMSAWQASGEKIIQNIEEIEAKEFNIIANNWQFIPESIEVNLGDKVRLNIKSVEGYHGISLFDFGINEYLAPEDKVSVEFLADKKGIFNFFCNVPCGIGHRNMSGQLIVK